MTPAYIVEGLRFSYEERQVLCVDRLEIGKGEIVALVGPNGSGKTTLLQILAFVETPQSGRIRLFGETVSRENLITFRRRVGFLLQNPYLFHTSVLANVLSGLKIRGVSGRSARARASAALDKVGLAGFEHRYALALSGGESQRVALARALVLDPEVLLLDEPANHMDVESVKRTEEIVLELNRTQGKTVVLTTHNLDQVQSFTTRVLRLSEGTLSPAHGNSSM